MVVVPVGVSVAVEVGIAVTVLVGVPVGVEVGLAITVLVGVPNGVAVKVLVGVAVGVKVGEPAAVMVGVTVATIVNVLVKVQVAFGQPQGVLVAVKVLLGACAEGDAGDEFLPGQPEAKTKSPDINNKTPRVLNIMLNFFIKINSFNQPKICFQDCYIGRFNKFIGAY